MTSVWWSNPFFSILLAYAAGFCLASARIGQDPFVFITLWWASTILGMFAVRRAADVFYMVYRR